MLFPSEEMFQLLLNKLRGVSREEFFDRVLHPNGRDMFMVIAMADNLMEKTKYLTEQTYSYHKTEPFCKYWWRGYIRTIKLKNRLFIFISLELLAEGSRHKYIIFA